MRKLWILIVPAVLLSGCAFNVVRVAVLDSHHTATIEPGAAEKTPAPEAALAAAAPSAAWWQFIAEWIESLGILGYTKRAETDCAIESLAIQYGAKLKLETETSLINFSLKEYQSK